MTDKVTYERINLAHPKIRKELKDLIEKINTSVLTGRAKVRIAYTLRTWAEQDALYAKGRTEPGKKVTKAKGGESVHNYGLAVDIVLIIDGKDASWDVKKDWNKDNQSDWMQVVAEFKKEGWEWGGDWISFKDMPHFEKTFGHSVKQLKNKYLKKDFIVGTEYVNI